MVSQDRSRSSRSAAAGLKGPQNEAVSWPLYRRIAPIRVAHPEKLADDPPKSSARERSKVEQNFLYFGVQMQLAVACPKIPPYRTGLQGRAP
jgi:hypothetical protein